MRFALVALLLAACELQPAPKQQPAPVIEVVPTPAPPPADAAVEADAAPAADAGPVPIAASKACITLAAHLVDVVVASATDDAQKTQYENERMTMTRSLAEACTQQPWSEESQKCYLATKTTTQIKACEKKFPLKPREAPSAGSGSAAGSAAPGPNGMRPEPMTGH